MLRIRCLGPAIAMLHARLARVKNAVVVLPFQLCRAGNLPQSAAAPGPELKPAKLDAAGSERPAVCLRGLLLPPSTCGLAPFASRTPTPEFLDTT